MAMFFYNPHPDPSHEKDRNTGDAYGWHAEIDESQGKLVVTYQKTEEKYIVDGFENKKKYTFCEKDENGIYKEIEIGEEPDLWYSFDPDHGNFHIVPDKSVKITLPLKDWLIAKLKCISMEVGDVSKDSGGNGAFEGCTDNHRYISADVGNNQYLMSFNRLWCDKEKHIHNNFGQAQFMCYPKEDGQINLFDGEFELMYPRSGQNKAHTEKGKHRVYNAPYDIDSNAKEIAKCFIDFMDACKNDRFDEFISKYKKYKEK